ncbi:MAG: M20/M25/M40 family metallo-hydrolase [Bacteroidota bacterium]
MYLRLLCYLTICACLASATLSAQSVQDLRVDVIYLASDYLEGRETGKRGEDLAAEYIATRFADMGLQPLGDDGSFYQFFDFQFSTNPHSRVGETRSGRNVIGYLDNGAPTTVVIGAHYDHIGRGGFGSRAPNVKEIHNGADDNASGVGALLYLAERLQKSDLKGQNYLFIAFSGEEMGLYGSKHFVKEPTVDFNRVSCMLNLDMVGRLDEKKSLIINGAGTSPYWKEAFAKITEPVLDVTTTDSGIGASDHTSFYLADLPALHFFTGNNTDYHTPTDDSEKINFVGIQEVAEWMYGLLEQLDAAGKLTFTKTKDNTGRRASSFKVTLGVMPDYAHSGEGMRLDAVIDDRPGQKAGLKDGDVIIKIGDLVVKDIYDYMEGLGKYEKGQTTTVVVKRGEEELTYEVTF